MPHTEMVWGQLLKMAAADTSVSVSTTQQIHVPLNTKTRITPAVWQMEIPIYFAISHYLCCLKQVNSPLSFYWCKYVELFANRKAWSHYIKKQTWRTAHHMEDLFAASGFSIRFPGSERTTEHLLSSGTFTLQHRPGATHHLLNMVFWTSHDIA